MAPPIPSQDGDRVVKAKNLFENSVTIKNCGYENKAYRWGLRDANLRQRFCLGSSDFEPLLQ